MELPQIKLTRNFTTEKHRIEIHNTNIYIDHCYDQITIINSIVYAIDSYSIDTSWFGQLKALFGYEAKSVKRKKLGIIKNKHGYHNINAFAIPIDDLEDKILSREYHDSSFTFTLDESLITKKIHAIGNDFHVPVEVSYIAITPDLTIYGVKPHVIVELKNCLGKVASCDRHKLEERFKSSDDGNAYFHYK